MQLTQSTGFRMEQRQLLTPRMIQSMEILQLPLLALEERIEQELQNNPVLELRDGDGSEAAGEAPAQIQTEADSLREDRSEDERSLVVDQNNGQAEDFDRLAKISEYLENEEYGAGGGSFRQTSSFDGERDRKMDAMANTAARGGTLQEHLLNQWAFIETTPGVRA